MHKSPKHMSSEASAVSGAEWVEHKGAGSQVLEAFVRASHSSGFSFLATDSSFSLHAPNDRVLTTSGKSLPSMGGCECQHALLHVLWKSTPLELCSELGMLGVPQTTDSFFFFFSE